MTTAQKHRLRLGRHERRGRHERAWPGAIISLPRTMTAAELDAFRTEWLNRYAGQRNTEEVRAN